MFKKLSRNQKLVVIFTTAIVVMLGVNVLALEGAYSMGKYLNSFSLVNILYPVVFTLWSLIVIIVSFNISFKLPEGVKV